MNGTKTIMVLSATLGALFGGVAIADLSDQPTPPHLKIYCGENSDFRLASLRRAIPSLRRSLESSPSNNVSRSENYYHTIIGRALDGTTLNQDELDCLMIELGFDIRSESNDLIAYTLYRPTEFPFNPASITVSFRKDGERPELNRVVIDTDMP